MKGIRLMILLVAAVAVTTVTTATTSVATSQPITVQIHHTTQGTRLLIPSGQLSQLPRKWHSINPENPGEVYYQTPSI